MSAKFVLYCIPKFEVNEPRLQLLREAVELIGDKRWRDILEIDRVPLSSIAGAIETRVKATPNAIGLLDQLYRRDDVGIIDRAQVVHFPLAVTGGMTHNDTPPTEAASMFRLFEPTEIYAVMVKLAIEDVGGDVRGARETTVS